MMNTQYPSMIILGATGSVGKQAADVARKHGVSVDAISANKSVLETENMVREFQPKACAMADEHSARDLALRVADLPVKIYSGTDGICEMINKVDADVAVYNSGGVRANIARGDVTFLCRTRK